MPRPLNKGTLQLGLVALLLACDSSTDPAVPGAIEAVSDTQLSGVVGAAVQPVPEVRILDQRGAPLEGTQVRFVVEGGGGTVTKDVAVTDATGRATPGEWRMGVSPGINLMSAESQGLPGVGFVATSVAGPAASLTVDASTDLQESVVGTAVPLPPAVLVEDQYGNPIVGSQVNFDVLAGAGTLSESSPVTNDAGRAAAGTWVLGTIAGENRLRASIAGSNLEAAITAVGRPGAPAALEMVSGDGQAAYPGRAVENRVIVRVNDQFGNAVSGTSVTFRATVGGGLVLGSPAMSNAEGIASPLGWTLGAPFNNRLVAEFEALDTVVFNAEGLIPNLSVALSASTIAVGGAASAAVATVRDGTGSEIIGRPVTWGSDRPDRATVDANGVVRGVSPGSACVTATVDAASRCANVFVGGTASAPTTPTLEIVLPSTTLLPGERIVATAVFRDEDGNAVDTEAPVWGSHNPGVAVVLASGEVVAISPGTSSISATVRGINKQVQMTVEN